MASDGDAHDRRAERQLKRGNAAVKPLSSVLLRDTGTADIQNYLGYAYRKAGKPDLAFKHYRRALALNPAIATRTNTLARRISWLAIS